MICILQKLYLLFQRASTLPSEDVAIHFLTPRAYIKAEKRGGGLLKPAKYLVNNLISPFVLLIHIYKP